MVGGILPQLSWDARWPPNRIALQGRPLKDTPESTAGALDLAPEQSPGAYLSPPYLFPRGPTLGFSLPLSTTRLNTCQSQSSPKQELYNVFEYRPVHKQSINKINYGSISSAVSFWRASTCCFTLTPCKNKLFKVYCVVFRLELIHASARRSLQGGYTASLRCSLTSVFITFSSMPSIIYFSLFAIT